MSLWKWNDVELEIDMEDYDFLEKYEKAFEAMQVQEGKLEKAGFPSDIVREYCEMFYRLFDDIFGVGTGDKLFHGRKNVRLCEECYDSFIEECRRSVAKAGERKNAMVSKYRPNRAHRQAGK